MPLATAECTTFIFAHESTVGTAHLPAQFPTYLSTVQLSHLSAQLQPHLPAQCPPNLSTQFATLFKSIISALISALHSAEHTAVWETFNATLQTTDFAAFNATEQLSHSTTLFATIEDAVLSTIREAFDPAQWPAILTAFLFSHNSAFELPVQPTQWKAVTPTNFSAIC